MREGAIQLKVIDGGKSASPKVRKEETTQSDPEWEAVQEAYNEEYRRYLQRVYQASMCWEQADWDSILKPLPWWERLWRRLKRRMGN